MIPPLPLEKRLAGLMQYGSWLASLLISLGFILAMGEGNWGNGHGLVSLGQAFTTLGVALFIALPILGVLVMLFIFFRQREYPLSAIAALVLALLLCGLLLGVHS